MKYLQIIILIAILCLPKTIFGQGITLKNVQNTYGLNSSFSFTISNTSDSSKMYAIILEQYFDKDGWREVISDMSNYAEPSKKTKLFRLAPNSKKEILLYPNKYLHEYKPLKGRKYRIRVDYYKEPIIDVDDKLICLSNPFLFK